MKFKQSHANIETELTSGRMRRNLVGANQFWLFESRGIEPAKPDPYYLDLRRGKMERQHAITEMKNSFGTADWFGWDYIERKYAFTFVNDLRAAMGLAPSGAATIDAANKAAGAALGMRKCSALMERGILSDDGESVKDATVEAMDAAVQAIDEIVKLIREPEVKA